MAIDMVLFGISVGSIDDMGVGGQTFGVQEDRVPGGCPGAGRGKNAAGIAHAASMNTHRDFADSAPPSALLPE